MITLLLTTLSFASDWNVAFVPLVGNAGLYHLTLNGDSGELTETEPAYNTHATITGLAYSGDSAQGAAKIESAIGSENGCLRFTLTDGGQSFEGSLRLGACSAGDQAPMLGLLRGARVTEE